MTPKPEIQYFISYARRNSALKEQLTEALQLHLSLSKDFSFKRWQDKDILVGDDWLAKIRQAIQQADTGLILLSPAFFASQVIRDHELPGLLEKSLGVIPVMLEPLDFSTMDLGEFNRLQVFTLQGKAFSQMTRKADKDKFVLELFRAMVRKMRARVLQAEV